MPVYEAMPACQMSWLQSFIRLAVPSHIKAWRIIPDTILKLYAPSDAFSSYTTLPFLAMATLFSPKIYEKQHEFAPPASEISITQRVSFPSDVDAPASKSRSD